jgi:pyrimidine-nucleoside phosphorylase
MQIQDVIQKKRDGGVLSDEEIHFFIESLMNGRAADYQTSALLMAIYLNGMNETERRALTRAMLHSGEILDFSDIAQPKADKHSTGGVGDKTSLIIAPLVAACGVCDPMISGRGLGHTGGTLDKLESIPGYNVNLSLTQFRRILTRVGYAMSGQTGEIAPADKKLYALRDATATVECLPLIVASIMSKKLAAGLDALVLDVKTGSGAFMREEERARRLAKALVETGNASGVRTVALITDMNQPLGRAVGNAVEVIECIRILRGEMDAGARATLELSIELAAQMLLQTNVEKTIEAARARLRDALDSGAAFERFRMNTEAQGGDVRVCDEPQLLSDANLHEIKVETERAGFVAQIDAAEIGRAVVELGGGRERAEDAIDHAVGFITEAHLGDEVKAGDALGIILCRSDDAGRRAAARIRRAYKIADEDAPPPALVKEIIAD